MGSLYHQWTDRHGHVYLKPSCQHGMNYTLYICLSPATVKGTWTPSSDTALGHLNSGTINFLIQLETSASWSSALEISAEKSFTGSLLTDLFSINFNTLLLPTSQNGPLAVSHASLHPSKTKREKDKGDYNREKSYCVKHLGGWCESFLGVAACKIPDATTERRKIRRCICVHEQYILQTDH